MSPLSLASPFRARDALTAGLVTPAQLRGPRFTRLFRGIYVRADTPVDLALRARGAVLLHPDAVVGGWAAAELMGASCGPEEAPVELIVPHRVTRRNGLVLREEVLPADETLRWHRVTLTTALRTAFDLARCCTRVEAVVALDALCRVGRFDPHEVIRFGYLHPGLRGAAGLVERVRLADPRSESPMESRIRIAIVDGGLPCPVPQHAVGRYRLDLAYPHAKLGIEFDGAHHRTAKQALHDLAREAFLTDRGWLILRFPAAVVLNASHTIPAAVAAELRRRA